MTDKSDRVLYVGQSGNLRQRLATYKNCNPNQLSRRIIRLIHQVQRIAWEKCDSVRDARVRENALLRLHRPKFNVVNVYPKAYAFIGLKASGREILLWMTREAADDPGLYGAFKGFSRYAFAALARSLWAVLHRPSSLDHFPCGMLATTPKRFRVGPFPEEVIGSVASRVSSYLDGSSHELVDWVEHSLSAPDASVFQKQLQAADIAILKDFFKSGPQRNLRLREQNGLEAQLILQEKLDDYIAASSPAVIS